MTRPLSGIYKITNNKNGKVYIGQSQNVYTRRAQHFQALNRHRHENTQMQKDYDKDSHGFRWDVVELCPLSSLNDREKYWIDKYNSIEKGYNQGWVPYKRKTKKKKKKGYHRSS